MSAMQLSFILVTVMALSIGQILFKMVAPTLEFSPQAFIPSLFNVKLIVALSVYFGATILWLAVLKTVPLRIAYPFISLAYFVVPILSHFIFSETLSWNTYAGALLIALGVWVSVFQ